MFQTKLDKLHWSPLDHSFTNQYVYCCGFTVDSRPKTEKLLPATTDQINNCFKGMIPLGYEQLSCIKFIFIPQASGEGHTL